MSFKHTKKYCRAKHERQQKPCLQLPSLAFRIRFYDQNKIERNERDLLPGKALTRLTFYEIRKKNSLQGTDRRDRDAEAVREFRR